MPDGSVLLCGAMPSPLRTYRPALLVHLDAAGQVLSENLLRPKEEQQAKIGRAYFTQCLPWGDRVAVIGHIARFVPPDAPRPQDYHIDEFYWVLMLDKEGNVLWEKLFPTALDTIEGVSSALVTIDGSLVFTGRRSTPQTELLRVSASGELETQKLLTETFVFTKPLVPDASLEIFGGTPNKTWYNIILNSHFDEITRAQGPCPSRFSLRDADTFRMPDQSLMLFGSGIHSVGVLHASRAVFVTPTLQGEQYIELAHEPYFDGGTVDAAVPTGVLGEFATVRELQKNVPGGKGRVGAALDFIRVK
jgi:hypothetical protein